MSSASSRTPQHNDEEDMFESVSCPASLTINVQAGDLQKGSFVVLKGHPCKIVEASSTQLGKHGHARTSLTALDIFTKEKVEESAPTDHTMQAPVVKVLNYTLIDISADGQLSLMSDNGDLRHDMDLPWHTDPELCKHLKDSYATGKDVTVSVTSALGKEQVSCCRVQHNVSKGR